MKILFIYKNEYIEPQGIMSLSGFLKQHGQSCDFIDIRFEKNIIKAVQKISPDIIAYSITTGRHKLYKKLNQELKQKLKFFSIFGGPHCTFFPEFIYEDGVDAICRGEGEYAFLELADNLEKGKDITKIKNLWVKKDDNVYKNEVRDLIEDLDTLPFPDRELVNKYNHYRKTHRRSMMTGRGCPYACTYCFNHSYTKLYRNKGKIVRRRSVANVIEELKFIKEKYRPRRFHFWDDTFNLDHKWTLDFADAYKKEIHMPFLMYLRVNLVTEEMVKALKEAGCVTAKTAIESGNEHIRNDILKRGVSEKEIINAFKLFNKYGLKIYVGNMIGLPDETLDMAFETLALNIKCKTTYPMALIYTPYPRTELCEYSKKRGYYDGDIDSIEETYFNKSIMKGKEILQLQRLHHLFSLGNAFPFLVPLIRILIKLPLDRLYLIFWYIHRAWNYFFRVNYIDFSEIFIRE